MEQEQRSTLKVSKIRDGIVIDHIEPGRALKVLSTLGITGQDGTTVSIIMNVKSKNPDTLKDIVKIENRVLKKKDLDKISLVSSDATINIIENYEITKKFKVEIPKMITGILKCPNQNCISNVKEPVQSEFKLESRKPVLIRCIYCDRTISESEIHTKF